MVISLLMNKEACKINPPTLIKLKTDISTVLDGPPIYQFCIFKGVMLYMLYDVL